MRAVKKKARGHTGHTGAHVWTCAGEAWKCTGLVGLAYTGPVCLSTYVSHHWCEVAVMGPDVLLCCCYRATVSAGDVLMTVIAKSKGLG